MSEVKRARRVSELRQDVDLACAEWSDDQDVAFELGDIRAVLSELGETRRREQSLMAQIVEMQEAFDALAAALARLEAAS